MTLFIELFILYIIALSISKKESDVTEIESGSIIDCARECKRNNLCHRASYDTLTKRCQISNDQTSNNCGVEKEAIQTSILLKRDDLKLYNFDRYPLVVSIYVGWTTSLVWTIISVVVRQNKQKIIKLVMRKDNNWLPRNQDDVSEWGDIYTIGLLFLTKTFIQMSLKLRILLIPKCLLLILIFTVKSATQND